MWEYLQFILACGVISSIYAASVGVHCSNYNDDTSNGDKTLCDAIKKKQIEGIYSNLYNKFTQNEELKDLAYCIVEHMRNSKYADLEIMKLMYKKNEGAVGFDEVKNTFDSLLINIEAEAIMLCNRYDIIF